jgi:hypothetical protein
VKDGREEHRRRSDKGTKFRKTNINARSECTSAQSKDEKDKVHSATQVERKNEMQNIPGKYAGIGILTNAKPLVTQQAVHSGLEHTRTQR